ncbi:MAG: nucleoside deaminase [Holosporaceae bacterium]|nr:nucleoside deaminase [Holosporaceae bacterium]
MELAMEEALKAERRGSVPVGAVVVNRDQVVSMAGNEVMRIHDPTAHAEILAIRRACLALKSPLLDGFDIYVTLEPCTMCAQAISLARIRRLYFGAYETKYGAVEHGPRIFNFAIHKTEVIGGIRETQCGQILHDFFDRKRKFITHCHNIPLSATESRK